MRRVLASLPLLLAYTIACRPAQVETTPQPASPQAPAQSVGQREQQAVPLTPAEARIREAVHANYDWAVDLLRESVNIPSGSQNVAGVRRVSDHYAAELDKLGFETSFAALPDSLRRAGHLVAVHRSPTGARLLLIGHLDTVYEGEGQEWVREDSIARGAGTSDMKGGNVAIILALKALAETGRLKDMNIIVVMTGDEESPGRPLSISRKALLDAARESDVALAFEGGTATQAAIGRRGSSSWRLDVTARQAHSAGVFSQGSGYGAAYEGARIVDEFRRELAGQRGLTFNIGVMAAGTTIEADTSGAITAAGKTNIIPPVFRANGDLRFLRDEHKDSARARMREIVARSLPGAQATITFGDSYPAMPITEQGERLLQLYGETSRGMGYPSVGTSAPESRGAGDVSFVAPIIPGIDGLGVDGSGGHSPRELLNLPSLRRSAERAAVFMSRLVDAWPRGG